jgi:mono/diheme cytochrome c family protein
MNQRVVAVFAILSIATTVHGAEPISFDAQIAPIFSEHCAKCHGEAKAQSRLRLDTIAGIEEKLHAKPQLLVAGNPDDSLLFQRLVLPDDSPKRMPKGGAPLSKESIDLIAQWIRQGAVLAAVATDELTAPAKAPDDRETLVEGV